MLNPVEIIRKKRNGENLSDNEIAYFFGEFLADRIADYQVSAWLMAAYLKGLSLQESATLTRVMRDSGRTLKWDNPALVADKHSTGGVGDKTSLVILPLCCLEGLTVPMISGRGLGHSGGTLDKLESISGLDVFLSEEKTQQVVGKHGGAFMGQTKEFAPLDKRLYALRDVTGTVESIGLITASILSKKSAEGLAALVMDVKYGTGAFMQNLDDARTLAKSIKQVGEANGMAVTCMLTDMNSVLGRSAGNSVEVRECLDIMRGEGPQDTIELSVKLAAAMVGLTKTYESLDDIEQRMKANLANGKALEKFKSIIADQGGDTGCIDDPSKLPRAKLEFPVPAPSSGMIGRIDVREVGMCVVDMKGGRRKVSDKIDHSVGIVDIMQVGESVEAGEPLCVIHANDPDTGKAINARLQSAFTVSDQPAKRELIAEVLT